jgi:putative hemolysin
MGNYLLNIVNGQIDPESDKAEKDNAMIANPASAHCVEQGGAVTILTAADGSQSGQCVFPDGRSCDEWDFFRTKTCK